MSSAYYDSQLLTFGAVTADGKPDITKILYQLPVPAQAMKISQKIRRDESKAKGKSGSSKQAVGFEDAEIEITLTLLDDEIWKNGISSFYSASDKLKELQQIFHDRSTPIGTKTSGKSASGKVPTVYSIQSPQTDDAGIKTVMIEQFDHSYPGNGKSDIEITLKLVEWSPSARQGEGRKNHTVGVDTIGNSDLDGNMSTNYYIGDPAADRASKEADTETGTESEFARGRRKAKELASGGGAGGSW